MVTPPLPPPRPDDAHKGTFGTVVVVGGSATMIGAPAMTATAAFRAGAGLVKIMAPKAILPYCLAIEPSATGLTADGLASLQKKGVVLAVGPGMGTGPAKRKAVAKWLFSGWPMVLDADGLNNLATLGPKARFSKAPLVLTPHPGEYQRLAAEIGTRLDPTDPSQRPRAAAELARAYKAVVVLKGSGTVVTDGTHSYVNRTGNPALATAGSGDVLTGVIAGLMAQGMSAFDAAVLGVYLHGAAADLWAAAHGRCGMLARELAMLIPDAIEAHRQAK